MRVKRNTLLLFLTFVVIGASGCSKEQIMGWFGQSPPDATAPIVKAPRIPSSPYMKLEVNPAIQTEECYIKLVKFKGDRPNVLAISSYEYGKDDTETFPSILIQAQVDAETLEDLADREIPVQLYATMNASGAVWSHPAGDFVKLKLTLSENGVTGDISGGNLVVESTDQSVAAQGKFFAKK